MSAFYGMVQGNRGIATRGGSRASGFKSSAQSYDGSIITYLSYDKDDNLMVTIEASDCSACYGRTIFHGTYEEYINKLKS
jgi:hypothetical protein